MALYIDIKFLGFISNRLEKFSKKDTNLWSFRCPVCLDSAKNKSKTRGYVYVKQQKAYACCHNCGYSSTFGNLLERVDPALYAEYRLETYKESHVPVKREPNTTLIPEIIIKSNAAERLHKKAIPVPTSLLDSMMDRLDTLPDDNEAVLYCLDRKIPTESFKKMYFIPNVCDIVQLSEKYRERVTSKEPRIVLPFFNLSGQLSGVTCRAIRGESLRYITVKVKEDDVLVFGINDIDRSKPIYVTEGPIDSLFVPNSIAVGGSSMAKIEQFNLPKDKVVIIFDNQPRNKEICRIIGRNIDAGYKVVIWNDRIVEKDINDMAKAGIDYMNEIETRIFVGLSAKMEFTRWKKC